jgi:alkanesulfonate monooxygenase SsuD/methylene tetrahydromethanopterin reductase-like flavin-dependent oxidoreductase (luciferase family)
MRISMSVTNFSWPDGPAALAASLAEVAVAAEEGGLDTLWVNDHLLQADPGAAPGERDMLEAYTTLGYLAARTARIRLGAMVSPVTYREPAVLLKAVTTLDVLSGGRAWLGVGVGYAVEAEAMGLPMPPTAERFERLTDLLDLAERMGRGDESPFEGRHHHLARPENRPLALQPGGIPVLVGGMGERRTLRLVARYARACNLFDVPDGGATVRQRLEVLRRHCAEVGRDPAGVETTISARLERDEDAGHVAERLLAMRSWGIEHAVFITPGPWREAAVQTLGAAADRVRDL